MAPAGGSNLPFAQTFASSAMAACTAEVWFIIDESRNGFSGKSGENARVGSGARVRRVHVPTATDDSMRDNEDKGGMIIIYVGMIVAKWRDGNL